MRKLISEPELTQLYLGDELPGMKRYYLSAPEQMIAFTEQEARNLYEALKEIFELEVKPLTAEEIECAERLKRDLLSNQKTINIAGRIRRNLIMKLLKIIQVD